MREYPARVLCALAIVAATILTSGCQGFGGDRGGDAPDGNGTAGDVVNDVSDEVRALVADTDAALEEYWTEAFPSISTVAFEPPLATELYTHDATPTGSGCLPADDPLWIDNSLYCAEDRIVYLDADLLPELGEEFANPDLAAVLVQAHEFAHHLQGLEGVGPLPVIGLELQADCYAGVFLAATEGTAVLDIGEWNAFDALNALRAQSDTEWNWLDPRVHGSPADRTQAMATGYFTADPRDCADYRTGDPPKPIEAGPYRIRPMPATESRALAGGGYRVTIDSAADQYLDVRSWNSLQPKATDALAQVAPIQFDGSEVKWVGVVEPFDHLAGIDAASLRYSQILEGQAYYGVLILATAGDGSGVLMDTYALGTAPEAGDENGWNTLGNHAFSVLWGVTS